MALTTTQIAVLLLSLQMCAWAHAAPAIRLEPIAAGLDQPVAVTQAGDGSGRLFITLRGGQILIHDGTRVRPMPFLDLTPLVSATPGWEDGLLSIAFHPDYRSNGLFYVDYVDRGNDIVVARYHVSATDPDVADASSGVVLLTIPHPGSLIHYGGQLQFGPPEPIRYLYISVGDGAPCCGPPDPPNNAQSLETLLGKILRIDVDAGLPYSIPATNPFVGMPPARGEIWALGLRNPWRFSFDRLTGDLFVGDVGQVTREEIDFQPAGARGLNYCWKRMEATLLFDPDVACTAGVPTLPVLEYDHLGGECAVIGGYRYRGSVIPSLLGIYLYGDVCSGRIWGGVEAGGGTWSATELLDPKPGIVAFGEDEAGELYVVDLGGVIYRIVPGFPGGVYVTVGNLDGGNAGIVTGAGAGGGPHVRAFAADGSPRPTSFYAYSPNFLGGVRVAACDFDVPPDGHAEIVTGAGPGGGPHVRVIALDPASGQPMTDLASFFAYNAAFTGGVFVACGDIDGDGTAEVVVGADAGGGPHVRLLKVLAGVPGGVVPLADFYAYAPGFTGGVRVAVGDLDGDGMAEIITGAGPGGGPHVKTFDGASLAVGAVVERQSLFAYDPAFRGGVFVAANGGLLVIAPDAGGGPHVRVLTGDLVEIGSFMAENPGFTGGVRVVAGPPQGALAGVVVTAVGPGGGPWVRGFNTGGAPTPLHFLAY